MLIYVFINQFLLKYRYLFYFFEKNKINNKKAPPVLRGCFFFVFTKKS